MCQVHQRIKNPRHRRRCLCQTYCSTLATHTWDILTMQNPDSEDIVPTHAAAFSQHRSQPPTLSGHPRLPDPLHHHAWSMASRGDCSGACSKRHVGSFTGVMRKWAQGDRGPTEHMGSSLVPLRDRQLPASFWQEPNVPRGYPFPCYPYDLQLFHPTVEENWGLKYAGMSTAMALETNPSKLPSIVGDAASSDANASAAAGMAGGGGGGGGGSKKGSFRTQSSKEFLERLQRAQARGYDLALSRFPITEFLFYNYGLKSYGLTPSSEQPASSFGESPLRCSYLLGTSVLDSTAYNIPRPDVGVLPGGVCSDGLAVANVGASEGSLAGGSTVPAAKLTFPTLCPYVGYSCRNLHKQAPHRFWDCVLGVSSPVLAPPALVSTGAGALSLSLSSSEKSSMPEAVTNDMFAGWKPVVGRSLSFHPGRYHPFTNA